MYSKSRYSPYSADFPFLWDEISVPIKHGTDYQLVKEILTRVVNEVVGNYVAHAKDSWTGIAAKYMVEAAMIDPQVTLVFNDNWIEFTVRYVVDYKVRRSTKDRLFTRILDELGRTEGRVAVAATTLQLVDPMPFDVRVKARRDEAKPVL